MTKSRQPAGPTVTFALDADYVARIEKYCDKNGVKRKHFFAEAIRERLVKLGAMRAEVEPTPAETVCA